MMVKQIGKQFEADRLANRWYERSARRASEPAPGAVGKPVATSTLLTSTTARRSIGIGAMGQVGGHVRSVVDFDSYSTRQD
jgi:hypothetical protein